VYFLYDISELERIGEEKVIIYFKVLSRLSHRMPESNHKDSLSGESVPQSRFKQGTS
jgi:hypothetical protein